MDSKQPKVGNPFRLSASEQRTEVIEQYRKWLLAQPKLMEEAKAELKGKVLGCWCAPKPCHGDVLLEIANGRALADQPRQKRRCL